jgi:hypothetical protein
VLIAFVGLTVRPITDIDTYWHVLIGRELLDTGRFSGLGNGWALYEPDVPWQTSQWAAEVAMAWLVDTFGWASLVWARTVMVVLVLGTLTAMLLRRATPAATAVVLALVAVPTNAVLQERPLLVSFLLLVWVSGASYDLLTGRRLPSPWAAGVLVLVWAQFHGMWVLAPASFALVALCLLIDRQSRSPGTVRRGLELAGLTAVAGCLSPVGPAGLLLPFTFRSATEQIAEWGAVPFVSGAGAGLLIMSFSVLCVWMRRPAAVPWARVIFLAVWVVVGMSAYRNIVPAAIMLAPLAASTLGTTRLLRRRPVAREQSTALAVVGGIFLIAATATISVATSRVEPLERAEPLAIAEAIAREPGPHRVFNAYNASGVLAAFGGSEVRLAIDGRSDRYGGEYIDRHLEVIALEGDWRPVFERYDPTSAVLPKDSALTQELVDNGWTIKLADADYVWLTPTAAPR